MRLDVYLSENGFAKSRTEAKLLISSGAVTVNGATVTKPAFDVAPEPHITVSKDSIKYVSRGGYKLEKALLEFSVSCEGKLCLDIGASSGGFTDCLLQNGAKSVIALDSGTMQLVDTLRYDSRVTVMENFNARYMTKNDLIYIPELAVMDVSFISATYIIPAVYSVLKDGADFICLIKPQFEVGRSGLGKGGIVKSEKLRTQAVEGVIKFAEQIGFEFVSKTVSPILGGDGNTEYLAHFKKPQKRDIK